MPVTSQRRVHYREVRKYGSEMDNMRVPPLTDIQTKAYDRFLQLDVAQAEREEVGLEGVLRETFPIDSYDGSIKLEYIKYELGKPRYTPDECRQLRLTYGRPFRVWLRLVKEEPIEEEVYLGDIPIMIGGGEFIVNGAEASRRQSASPEPRSRFRLRHRVQRREATIPAGLFPSVEVGSRFTSRRKRRWVFVSTRAENFPL